MTAITFNEDHRIIDLSRLEYYHLEDDENGRPNAKVVMGMVLSKLNLLSILLVFIFKVLSHFDPVIITCHATLTVDCYHIQIKYYLWTWAVNTLSVLLTGG